MSFRSWATVITLVLLSVVVFFGWHDIVKVWELLGKVNLWILALLIPIQVFSYYAAGNIVFSYLKAKGNLKGISRWTMTRMSLELNFVNHILPSGGAAGFSYLGWVLSRHGVSAGRATMAQLVRFAMTYIAFLLLMAVSILVLILDNSMSRAVVFVGVILVSMAIVAAVLLVYIIGNKSRIIRFSDWITKISNKFLLFVTKGRAKNLIKDGTFNKFFTDLHQDYIEIKREKNILSRPFIWGIILNIADAALLFITFWAMGIWVNPVILLIAFGTSAVAGIISVLPAGAGVYEAVMIGFLVSAGVSSDVAIAGTFLSRVVLVSGTILFGYFFYQLTILKYGKRPTNS